MTDEPDDVCARIVAAAKSKPGPVVGPRDRDGRKYAMVPRGLVGMVLQRVQGRHERIVFQTLVSGGSKGFHPSGLFPVFDAEWTEYLGVGKRIVRATFASLERQGVLVWDASHAIVFVPDASHLQINSPKVAANVLVHIESLGVSRAVDAARAYFGLDTPPGGGMPASVQRESVEREASSPTSNGAARQAKRHCEEVKRWELRGSREVYAIVLPASYTQAHIRKADSGDRELIIAIAADALLCAQQDVGRELDRRWYVREKITERVEQEAWTLLHLLRRVAVRYAETERKQETGLLCTPACFERADRGGVASCTDVMVAQAFADDEFADHTALTEWRDDR